MTTKATPPPYIDGLTAKVGTLERRRQHLARRLERADYTTTPAADFDRAEISALDGALDLMRWRNGAAR